MPSHLPPEIRERLAEALRETLRTARESAALTQEQMAERLGLGVSTYKRLERGVMSPGVRTLRKLSQVLCLSLDALLGPECARAVEQATRPPRRKRPARSRAPRARALPMPPQEPPLLPWDSWGMLAATARFPVAHALPLLLVRRGTPLALVVDVG
ncbi:helix-turn-helix domain-containing protein [Archangium lansingense]|uniref:Helix-turn-helix transcriptional regulator n=1 Tax=Archangium lansingense TaxID=2995310 RepID=A0ABT3ZUD5_9BACT|nr:helix-turn-helix transcriptional regulator [Archangium lansinium]MCY1073022.1 helix-turn-helix transcriptional regulator [Archangium lansinium]